jgi:hypothetical protein
VQVARSLNNGSAAGLNISRRTLFGRDPHDRWDNRPTSL